MIAVDASVLVAALIDSGPLGEWAEDQLVDGGILYAPSIVHTEATNALRRTEIAGQIEPSVAAIAFANLQQVRMRLVPFELLAARIWELRANVTSYDAAYVATAELINSPLATLDIRLTNAPGPTCSFVSPPALT